MAYLAPLHQPSSVRHAIRLSFLAPDSPDLIVAKSNRLDIYTPHPQQPDQHILHHSQSLYGKVTMLEKLRPASCPTDHLFVGTDQYHYFTLSWDSTRRELKTEKAYVDVAEKAARDSQTGDRVHIDPTARFMALECYEGVVNVVPIAHAGKGKRKVEEAAEYGELLDPVPVRIPEMFVKSSGFLHKRSGGGKLPNPELALLFEDQVAGNKVRLKVRELDFTPSLRPQEEPPTVEMEKGRDVQGDVELGATFLIPLPPPMYGMLIVGETSISYVDEWDYRIAATEPLDEATIFVAWCQVDEQRYCLADDYGRLYLLFLHQDESGEYNGHTLDVLGQTSRASTLVYLDSGRIFLGSHQGDSQIIQIREQGLDVVQTFANLAPILDFTVMDMGNRSADAQVNEFSSGQARIVTGSGAYSDGSLRSVRSGVGLEDLGAIGEMGAPVSTMFALSSSKGVGYQDTLLVSLVDSTRVFKFDEAGEVEEVEAFGGSAMDQGTLYAGNLPDGRIIQVTSSAVLVVESGDSMVQDSWRPDTGVSITDVAADDTTLLISLGGASLVALDLQSSSSITEKARRTLDPADQISCIALSPDLPNTALVGFWSGSRVSTLDLTASLATVATLSLAESDPTSPTAIPRSLLTARLAPSQPPTLFIGLADGTLFTYALPPTSPFPPPHPTRNTLTIGTSQPNLVRIARTDYPSTFNLLATADLPSLLYASPEGRLISSAVTAETPSAAVPFNHPAYPSALALATGAEGEVKLALVDEERTTHIQTLSLGHTVRRIAHSLELGAFGLGTVKRTLEKGQEIVESFFRLVDEIGFAVIDQLTLKEDELVECVLACALPDGSPGGGTAERFVVGTAFLGDEDTEVARGRILVLEVTEERKIKIVVEAATRGACRCLGIVEGRVVAGLVKTVVVYALEHQATSTPTLAKVAAYRCATAPISLAVSGTTIAVADLMKSLTLLHFNPSTPSLQEIARHFDTFWSTAAAPIDTNTYLLADATGNLLLLAHDTKGYSAEDRHRLNPIAEFHLGEMVNRIVPISVTPSPSAPVVPAALLATVEGGVYVLALISPALQDPLMRLQSALVEREDSLGRIPFESWRGFRHPNSVMGVHEASAGPVRFVDSGVVERVCGMSEEALGLLVKDMGGWEGGVEGLRGLGEALRRVR